MASTGRARWRGGSKRRHRDASITIFACDAATPPAAPAVRPHGCRLVDRGSADLDGLRQGCVIGSQRVHEGLQLVGVGAAVDQLLHLVGERVQRHHGALRYRGVGLEFRPHVVNPCHFDHSFRFDDVESVDHEIELAVDAPKLSQQASLHVSLLAIPASAGIEKAASNGGRNALDKNASLTASFPASAAHISGTPIRMSQCPSPVRR